MSTANFFNYYLAGAADVEPEPSESAAAIIGEGGERIVGEGGETILE